MPVNPVDTTNVEAALQIQTVQANNPREPAQTEENERLVTRTDQVEISTEAQELQAREAQEARAAEEEEPEANNEAGTERTPPETENTTYNPLGEIAE